MGDETTPEPQVVTVEIDGPIATVTMNRPERRNALNRALRSALTEALSILDADESVRAIVLTGAGSAFCAGLDLDELAGSGTAAATAGGPASEPPPPVGRTATPVIGAINGAAITGGLELALNCDILIASDAARFADTHARVGIMPWWGLTYLLPAAVGRGRAIEMSLTGNFVDADTALQWGLVNRVVPAADLLSAAQSLARDIAGVDTGAAARLLATYREGRWGSLADARRLETEVATDWLANLGSGTVAANRAAVIDRGRHQADS